MTLQDYQIRMLNERHALQENISKLSAFISRNNDNIAWDDLSLLRAQRDAMTDYFDILNQRCNKMLKEVAK